MSFGYSTERLFSGRCSAKPGVGRNKILFTFSTPNGRGGGTGQGKPLDDKHAAASNTRREQNMLVTQRRPTQVQRISAEQARRRRVCWEN